MDFDGGINFLLRENYLGYVVCVMFGRYLCGYIEMVIGYYFEFKSCRYKFRSRQYVDVVRFLILNEVSSREGGQIDERGGFLRFKLLRVGEEQEDFVKGSE